MSDINSNFGEKKRFVTKNPDGTFSHCYKSGEKDSACEAKPNESRNQENANPEISLSDEELRYIIDSTAQDDYPILVEQILDLFRKYRLFFIFLKCSEMFLFWMLIVTTWVKRESSITLMEEVYHDLNTKEAAFMFHLFFHTTVVMNFFYYPFGFFAIIRKNVKLLKLYTHLTLVVSIMTIIMIYINILFVFVFVFRLVLYGFSRFLANLLISLLILPRQFNQLGLINYNTI